VVVRVVGDVLTHTLPAHALRLCLPFRVHEGLHALVEGGVRLEEVKKVEGVLAEASGVGDLEEKPLRKVVRVVVRLHDQIVLLSVHLCGSAQVARLKTRLELEGVVGLVVNWVEGLQRFEVAVDHWLAFLWRLVLRRRDYSALTVLNVLALLVVRTRSFEAVVHQALLKRFLVLKLFVFVLLDQVLVHRRCVEDGLEFLVFP